MDRTLYTGLLYFINLINNFIINVRITNKNIIITLFMGVRLRIIDILTRLGQSKHD